MRNQDLPRPQDALPKEENSPLDERLNSLLQMPAVAVPEDLCANIMRVVRAESLYAPGGEKAHRRQSSGKAGWTVALIGAAALLAIIALAGRLGWGASSAAGAEPSSLLGTLGAALSSVLLAGAGLLGATWQSVGTSVGSWIGASPTVGAFLALAFLGAVGVLGFSVRRARQRSS